jgi:hypothetical protein
MQQPQFHPGKNDFFFAFLMTAVFVITVAGAIGGYLDLARGRVDVDYVKTRGAPVALRDATERAPQIARAGPGR